MTSENELRDAVMELTITLTKILKIVQPLIEKATEESLERSVKL